MGLHSAFPARLLVLVAVTLAAPSVAVAGPVSAGVARETFILPPGVPLAGYSRRHGKPSTGMHDPLGVRALVLADGDTTVALVSCDLLIIDDTLFETARTRLRMQGLPPDLVLLMAATHTHSGPGAYGRRFFEKLSMGHFDARVFEAIVDAVGRAVARAWQSRAEVRLASASGLTEGLVQNRVQEGGPVDAEVAVTGVYPAGGEAPLAVLLSFAAHPTTLGAWNMELSGDYPAAAVREIERRIPSATAIFFAGDVGDQAPVKSGDRFERPERIGRAVADRAVALVQGLRPEPVSEVSARQERMRLPPGQLRLGRLTVPRWLSGRLVDDDATLSVVTAGSTVIFGAPCDVASGLGVRLKEAARARRLQPQVVSFACDYIGYCVPEPLYREKQYESSMAFNGPRAGDMVVERLMQLLDEAIQR